MTTTSTDRPLAFHFLGTPKVRGAVEVYLLGVLAGVRTVDGHVFAVDSGRYLGQAATGSKALSLVRAAAGVAS